MHVHFWTRFVAAKKKSKVEFGKTERDWKSMRIGKRIRMKCTMAQSRVERVICWNGVTDEDSMQEQSTPLSNRYVLALDLG
jgi:hypothetical protein